MTNNRNLFIVSASDPDELFDFFKQDDLYIFKDFIWLGKLEKSLSHLVKNHIEYSSSIKLLGLTINYLIVNLINNFNIEAFARGVNAVAHPGIVILLISKHQRDELDLDSQIWNEEAITTPNFYQFYSNLLLTVQTENISELPTVHNNTKSIIESITNENLLLDYDQQFFINNFINKLNNFGEQYLIYGKRGAGKTTLLKYLCLELSNNKLNKDYQIILSAPSKASTFNIDDIQSIKFVAPDKLSTYSNQDLQNTIVIIDEAAQIPISLLETITNNKPKTLLLSTTIEGYEGNCLGFVYKYLRDNNKINCHKLNHSHRWSQDDEIELFIRSLTGTSLDIVDSIKSPFIKEFCIKSQLSAKTDQLSDIDRVAIYKLLYQTHYKTRLNDLRRLFDATNSYPYLIKDDKNHSKTIGLIWYIIEQVEYTKDVKEQIIFNARRPKGNILLQKLATLLKSQQVLNLKCLRISRISVDRKYRKQGISKMLLDLPSPSELTNNNIKYDFIGVLYSHNTKLIKFWESHGFQTVFISNKNSKFANSGSVLAVKGISKKWNKTIQPIIDNYLNQSISDLPKSTKALFTAVNT